MVVMVFSFVMFHFPLIIIYGEEGFFFQKWYHIEDMMTEVNGIKKAWALLAYAFFKLLVLPGAHEKEPLFEAQQNPIAIYPSTYFFHMGFHE